MKEWKKNKRIDGVNVIYKKVDIKYKPKERIY
jgi:hypothetical protein